MKLKAILGDMDLWSCSTCNKLFGSTPLFSLDSSKPAISGHSPLNTATIEELPAVSWYMSMLPHWEIQYNIFLLRWLYHLNIIISLYSSHILLDSLLDTHNISSWLHNNYYNLLYTEYLGQHCLRKINNPQVIYMIDVCYGQLSYFTEVKYKLCTWMGMFSMAESIFALLLNESPAAGLCSSSALLLWVPLLSVFSEALSWSTAKSTAVLKS